MTFLITYSFNLYWSITLQVRKTSARLGSLSMDDKKTKTMEIQILKMVISVVVMFVCCNSFQVMAFYMLGTSGDTFKTYIVFLLGYFFAALNSSINAVVYGIFNKKYRAIFLEYFCCKSSKWANESSSGIQLHLENKQIWMKKSIANFW